MGRVKVGAMWNQTSSFGEYQSGMIDEEGVSLIVKAMEEAKLNPKGNRPTVRFQVFVNSYKEKSTQPDSIVYLMVDDGEEKPKTKAAVQMTTTVKASKAVTKRVGTSSSKSSSIDDDPSTEDDIPF